MHAYTIQGYLSYYRKLTRQVYRKVGRVEDLKLLNNKTFRELRGMVSTIMRYPKINVKEVIKHCVDNGGITEENVNDYIKNVHLNNKKALPPIKLVIKPYKEVYKKIYSSYSQIIYYTTRRRYTLRETFKLISIPIETGFFIEELRPLYPKKVIDNFLADKKKLTINKRIFFLAVTNFYSTSILNKKYNQIILDKFMQEELGLTFVKGELRES